MSTDTTRNGHDTSATTTEMLAVLQQRGLIQDITAAATVLGIAGAADNPDQENEFTPAVITDNASVVLEKRYLDARRGRPFIRPDDRADLRNF
jgi:hypothetical protein